MPNPTGPIPYNLARRLSFLRNAQTTFTQAALSERLHCSKTTYQRRERGIYSLSLDDLWDIAQLIEPTGYYESQQLSPKELQRRKFLRLLSKLCQEL